MRLKLNDITRKTLEMEIKLKWILSLLKKAEKRAKLINLVSEQ